MHVRFHLAANLQRRGQENMSSVHWIVPCPEFSTGTTSQSA